MIPAVPIIDIETSLTKRLAMVALALAAGLSTTAVATTASAFSIGECAERPLVCQGTDAGCATDNLPLMTFHEDEPLPCQDESLTGGHCKEADDSEELDSWENLGHRPDAPIGLRNIYCDGSDSRCSGIPAPDPKQQLRAPVPTPSQGTRPEADHKVWLSPIRHYLSRGKGPSEGSLSQIDRPPWS